MSTATQHPARVMFPGQTAFAEGPHDQTGMYMMHHAFRRDLGRFVAAVAGTPLHEAAVWTALGRRWAQFDEVLHHHHEVEDTAFWPVMLRHADVSGSAEDRATLEAMEAEHATIDPSLAACRTGFALMQEDPSDEHRAALLAEVTELNRALCLHLRHEETEALPILQRTVSVAEYAQMEAAAKNGYPSRMIPFIVPWVLDGLDDVQRAHLFRMTGRAYVFVYRLVRRRYERAEAVTFRYA